MRSAMSIANYFVQRAVDEKCTDFTILKMMKLVYIAHGFLLATMGESFFDETNDEEQVEAWRFGPVIPLVYKEYTAIKDKFNKVNKRIEETRFFLDENDSRERLATKVCSMVWTISGGTGALALVDILHAEGTPWQKYYQPGKNVIIPDEATRDYYTVIWKRLRTATNN